MPRPPRAFQGAGSEAKPLAAACRAGQELLNRFSPVREAALTARDGVRSIGLGHFGRVNQIAEHEAIEHRRENHELFRQLRARAGGAFLDFGGYALLGVAEERTERRGTLRTGFRDRRLLNVVVEQAIGDVAR